MRKFVAIAVLCLVSAYGFQDSDPAVAISGGPPGRAWSVLYFYTLIGGADYPEYFCYALANQPATTLSVTQIVDAANTATVTTSAAHGLSPGNRVVVAGVTGDTDLNGTQIILTVGSTTSFTYTSAAVTDATYNNAGITLTTSAPRTTEAIWSIKKLRYGGTGGTSQISTQWAVRSTSVIASTGTDHACDARATLAYQ